VAGEVRPFRKGKKGIGSPRTKKIPTLTYKAGDLVMARWPGSRLYYNAQLVTAITGTGEYEVEFENGVTFTLTPKDVYKEPTMKKKMKKENSDNSEGDDITSLLVKAAGDAFKEPALKRRASNGSQVSRRSQFDAFSDDEELLSVSQRPSVSSNVSMSEKSSTFSSKFERVSFSSTINKLLDGVFTEPSKVTNGPQAEEGSLHNTANEELSNSVVDQKESVNISEEVKADEKNRNSRIKKKPAKSPFVSNDREEPPSQSDSSRLDDFSEDELGDLKPSSQKIEERSASLDWMVSLFFMILSPLILISLHNFSSKTSLSLLNYSNFWDTGAFFTVTGFLLCLSVCEFVCMGNIVEGFRMNGFQTLVLALLSVPVLLGHGVSLAPVTDHYSLLMTSAILVSIILASLTYLGARLSGGGQELTNPISDLYHGLKLHPRLPHTLGGAGLKLQLFRFSMVGLAVLNLALVTQSVLDRGSVNTGVLVTASLQILYCMDAMWYEPYYFYSADYLNSGTGLSLISSYLTFPFLPTLITRSMIHFDPEVGHLNLAIVALLNIVGYVIYRSSETVRCELARDPKSKVDGIQTEDGIGGRKLIVSGWWRLVRHPNYTGEIMVQWSWVLPLLCTVGLQALAALYLPVVTTLMLIVRCEQTNIKNRRKFGRAWEDYTRRVTSNIIPYVY